MSRLRTDMHRLQELVRLHRMQTPCRDVARMLSMSPRVERKYRLVLEAASLLAGGPDELPSEEQLKAAVLEHSPPKAKPQQTSTVEKWMDKIKLMAKRGAGPTAIYDCLRLKHEDFKGSISAVKRACARLKRERGVRPEDVAIPVETDPGEVAQVDFGYVGKLYDPIEGRLRKAWVFIMTMGCASHLSQVRFQLRLLPR